MDRARRAGFTALIVVVLVAAARRVRRAASPRPRRSPGRRRRSSSPRCRRAAPRRPTSSSRSPTRAPAPVDLAGLEVVYATSSGSTVTRKATWTTSTILEPGQARPGRERRGHRTPPWPTLTYSGGFAATGGAIALRVVGGATIDAVGWGDATTRSSRGPRLPRRRPGRASSARRAVRPATGPTRTTTSSTGSSRARRRRRVWARLPCRHPGRRRRRRRPPTPTPHRRLRRRSPTPTATPIRRRSD